MRARHEGGVNPAGGGAGGASPLSAFAGPGSAGAGAARPRDPSCGRPAGGGPPRAAHQMRRVHVEIPAVGQGQSIYNNFKDILQMFI